MMYDNEPQANPEVSDGKLANLREKTERTVTVLEENKGAIHRWFWKAVLAFNVVLASIVIWSVVIPHLVQLV